jgi:hypothetical protein
LASALRRKGQLDEAKREVLFALEEKPRYREAQKLLLELVAQIEGMTKENGTLIDAHPR